MIQANELRIGNWVTVRLIGIETEGTPQQINANNLVDIAEEKGAFLNKKCYDAIPLTPEILEKSGFKIGAVRMEMNVGDISFGKSLVDNSVLLYDANNYNTGVSVKYVHKLQNLFYELTGQELEIKL